MPSKKAPEQESEAPLSEAADEARKDRILSQLREMLVSGELPEDQFGVAPMPTPEKEGRLDREDTAP